jgi:hypothetical protein
MLNKLINQHSKTIQISIGEEGIVVVLCNEGVVLSKLFVSSTDEKETTRLRQLLNANPNASLHIYLDNLDQSYIQRTLPGVGAFSIGKVAQTRLEREVPKNYLKGCIQLGRIKTGRKDWIYTFISTPLEPPVSLWLDYFLPYQNVIRGIYFCPIEIYSIIQKIKSIKEKQSDTTNPKKKVGKFSLKKTLDKSAPTSKWELFVSHNKTGGFRQIAYQDGNIVFSRLLTNIADTSAEVVAGSIEFEITNSIEYLARLSISSKEKIDIYLLLADDIVKCIRTEKLKGDVFALTPYQLSNMVNLVDASGEKDKFADPTILACLSKFKKRRLTLHTPVTALVNKYTRIVDMVNAALKGILPILLIFIIASVFNVFSNKYATSSVKDQIAGINKQIADSNKILNSIESKIEGSLKIQQLNELITLHDYMTTSRPSPSDFFLKLSEVLPATSKVKTLHWEYFDLALFKQAGAKASKATTRTPPNTPAVNPGGTTSALQMQSPAPTGGGASTKPAASTASTANSTQKNNQFGVEMEISFIAPVQSYDGLEQIYSDFSKVIKASFKNYDVQISDLPQSFSLSNVNQNMKPITILVKLSQKLGVDNKESPKKPDNTEVMKKPDNNESMRKIS